MADLVKRALKRGIIYSISSEAGPQATHVTHKASASKKKKIVQWWYREVVYELKSVGHLEMKFVAPIPEQIATTPMSAFTDECPHCKQNHP